MDLYEIKYLGWLLCLEFGFQFIEQLDDLEQNELSLKSGHVAHPRLPKLLILF